MFRRFAAALAATLVVVLIAGCSNSNSDEECGGFIKSASQLGNDFSASGTVNKGQPILTLTGNGRTFTLASDNYGPTYADFDVTGIPKGVYSATWVISCDDGSGQKPLSNSVPTMTIQ